MAYTKSQSFEFVGYYYYYFQLPFPEHPLRCRDYLRLGSLEIGLVQEHAGRLFKAVLPGDALKDMKGANIGQNGGGVDHCHRMDLQGCVI